MPSSRLAVVGLACFEEPGAAGKGALECANATPSVKVIDDSFDDNPGERQRTPANRRFEKLAYLSGFPNASERLRTYEFGLWL